MIITKTQKKLRFAKTSEENAEKKSKQAKQSETRKTLKLFLEKHY